MGKLYFFTAADDAGEVRPHGLFDELVSAWVFCTVTTV